MTAFWPAIAILAFVTAQRLIELPIARANTARLLAAGGREVAPRHYPFIVAFHAIWLATLWWLAPGEPVNLLFLTLLGVVQIGRIWVLRTLGERWTTRIIIVPNEKLVTHGPYRFVDHPNYLVVVAEIALLPLVFGLVEVAMLFSALNAVLLAIRLTAESRALESIRS